MTSTLRINFWSSPRNISTAMMYCFAQRNDITVVDEPLYAHYLSTTKSTAQHPGEVEILANMEQDGEKVVQDIILGNYETPVALFKQMTHHLPGLKKDFLTQTANVLLIRDPRRIIASYTKVIQQPSIDDIGVRLQLELLHYLKRIKTLKAVVDARRLLENPRPILEKLCKKLDISFQENMLQWQAGARPEDGIWAKHWYTTVHQSTGFQPYVSKEVKLPEHLEQLAEECAPYYEELLKESL